MKIFALIFQVAMVSVGAFAGLMYNANMNAAPQSHDSADAEGHAGGGGEHKAAEKPKQEKPKKEKAAKKDAHGGDQKAKKSGGHHGGSKSSGASPYEYMKFGRQFIVPVIGKNAVNSLVVLDINLEVPSSSLDTVYAREPKIRDALLSTLLRLSNEHAFDEAFLTQANLDMLRETLLTSAQTILADDVHNILILSISKQDL